MSLKYILILLVLCNAGLAQTSAFYTKARRLIGTFGVYHFQPPPINGKTSAECVDLFIRDLDTRGLTLKASDVARLKENSDQLFTQIYSQKDSYIKNAHAIYVRALTVLDSILTAVSQKDLNFNANDTSYFLPYTSGVFYSGDLKYHAKRIERFIKVKSYERVANSDNTNKLSEAEFNAKAQGFAKSILSHLQKNIRDEITTSYPYVEAALLNAIALRHDPHSNYFTQEQNQEFSNQLSAQVESFGFYLDENEEGLPVISHIDPGGSAWISNEINVGDLFLSLRLANEQLSIEDQNVATIQEKLDKTLENKIELTIKKQNGLVKSIKLIRQKTDSRENSVKGYLLSASALRLGYISLPSFYTDMDGHSLPGCANDVAKEILKLERDSIKGLILDLRNNGGGSMEEAMNLAGIFIDEGPLFLIRERNKKPSVVKDINRGAIFKKPLVVLINETSASASELFSNIVRDYQLGLIVGQTSYGKGTAQNILPLDTLLLSGKNPEALKNNPDYLKITDSKFYRLNGSTHQGIGIRPDIVLPPTPGYAIYKENREPFFLAPDSVVKKVIFSPNPPILLGPLQDNSSQRVAGSSAFNRYTRIGDSLTAFLNSRQKVALKVKDYRKFRAEGERLYTSYEQVFENNVTGIRCLNNSFDLGLEQVSPQAREFNTRILTAIQKDSFINESFLILNDLIHQQNP